MAATFLGLMAAVWMAAADQPAGDPSNPFDGHSGVAAKIPCVLELDGRQMILLAEHTGPDGMFDRGLLLIVNPWTGKVHRIVDFEVKEDRDRISGDCARTPAGLGCGLQRSTDAAIRMVSTCCPEGEGCRVCLDTGWSA